MRYLQLIILITWGIQTYSQDPFRVLSEKAERQERQILVDAGAKKQDMQIYEYKVRLSGFDEVGRMVQSKDFDEKGYLVEQTSYFANASKSTVNIKDDKGYLIEEQNQMPKGNTIGRIVYENNESGHHIRAKEYGRKKELKFTYEYTYDKAKRTKIGIDTLGKQKTKEELRVVADSNKEENLIYNWKNEMYKSDIIEFDELGRKKRWTVINTTFNQYSVTEYVYEDGLLTDVKYLDAYGVMRRYRENKYNDKKLLIESILYDLEGNPKNKTIYTYQYF